MTSKKIVMTFIDDTTGRVLDNVHKILRQYKDSKKDADKVIKYIIKSLVKVGILFKNDQFSREELNNIEQFKQKFHLLMMTIVSFHEVDFTYDKTFLKNGVDDCRRLLQTIIARHLTEKSKMRVDRVFNTFCEPELLDAVFISELYKHHMDTVVADLTTLMDQGNL